MVWTADHRGRAGEGGSIDPEIEQFVAAMNAREAPPSPSLM
jgi:hypothetical protein